MYFWILFTFHCFHILIVFLATENLLLPSSNMSVINAAFYTMLIIIPSILQALCLLMGKKWPISFPPSPSAQLSPSTWRWSAFFPLTTTQAMWTASSCGLRLVRGAGRWFLIGCSTKSWTASSSVVPSHTRGGKCWFSDAVLPGLLMCFVIFVSWCQSCLQCFLTHIINHKVELFLHCSPARVKFWTPNFFLYKESYIYYFIVTPSTLTFL